MTTRRGLLVRIALALASIAAAVGGATRVDVTQARRHRRHRHSSSYPY